MLGQFVIAAHWERRADKPKTLAARLRRYIELARPAIPVDLHWFFADAGKNHSPDLLAPSRQMDFDAFVEAHVVRDDDGSACPLLGYRLIVYLANQDPGPNPSSGSLIKIAVGASQFQNDFFFYTDLTFDDKIDPRLVTYDVVRAHMMAIVWAFQPSWCTAAPFRLFSYLDREPYVRPPIDLAWMTWLEPALARQMQPPPSSWNTIVEGYSDDSVFMATGKDTFDVEIGDHLRAARAIHRQLDHLNYIVPFEGMRGRSPRVPPFPDAPPATWNAWGEDR